MLSLPPSHCSTDNERVSIHLEGFRPLLPRGEAFSRNYLRLVNSIPFELSFQSYYLYALSRNPLGAGVHQRSIRSLSQLSTKWLAEGSLSERASNRFA